MVLQRICARIDSETLFVISSSGGNSVTQTYAVQQIVQCYRHFGAFVVLCSAIA